jgi:hypothetical protein
MPRRIIIDGSSDVVPPANLASLMLTAMSLGKYLTVYQIFY